LGEQRSRLGFSRPPEQRVDESEGHTGGDLTGGLLEKIRSQPEALGASPAATDVFAKASRLRPVSREASAPFAPGTHHVSADLEFGH
jgi:hypothetical protein